MRMSDVDSEGRGKIVEPPVCKNKRKFRSCRSLQALSNEYLVAKIAVETVENGNLSA